MHTIMAAFRIVYLPPASSHFSHTNTFLPSPNHRLLPLVTKPQRSTLHLFLVKEIPQFRALALTEAQPIVQSEPTEEEADGISNTKLLIQNLPWTCTLDEVRPLVEKYGTVVDIEFAMYNKTRNRNRGLAFVTMASHEEAAAAINALESSEFGGRVLKLNWAKPKKPKPPPPQPKPMPVHNLFVSNLHFEVRAKDLKEFFEGKAVSSEVIFHDKPRRSSGYGFVAFNTKADAEAALVAFQGKELMGRPIRVARSKSFLRQETKATIELESVEENTKAAIESESAEETTEAAIESERAEET